jgi:hypothetical protein
MSGLIDSKLNRGQQISLHYWDDGLTNRCYSYNLPHHHLPLLATFFQILKYQNKWKVLCQVIFYEGRRCGVFFSLSLQWDNQYKLTISRKYD